MSTLICCPIALSIFDFYDYRGFFFFSIMGFRTLIRKLLRVKQPVDLVDLSPPTRSRSSSQSSYDEPKGDRPWRSLVDRKLRYKPGSGFATRRKAYRNRILLIIFILCVLASIAVGFVTPVTHYIAVILS